MAEKIENEKLLAMYETMVKIRLFETTSQRTVCRGQASRLHPPVYR